MIAAGANAKALCTFMRHSSIQATIDRYGQSAAGREDEAAALLDAYLEQGHTVARTSARAAPRVKFVGP